MNSSVYAALFSVLASSCPVHRLPPYHRNFGKRLVKTPKLYFLDVGLACWLLGITSPAMLSLHPFQCRAGAGGNAGP